MYLSIAIMCDVTHIVFFSLALPKEAIGNHAALRKYGYSCYCLSVLC